jgi:hypothetical protein
MGKWWGNKFRLRGSSQENKAVGLRLQAIGSRRGREALKPLAFPLYCLLATGFIRSRPRADDSVDTYYSLTGLCVQARTRGLRRGPR